MTKQVKSVRADTSVLEVARIMRDKCIGDVLVTEPDGTLCGIVTDRDIVVRAAATDLPLDKTWIGQICTDDLVYVNPDTSVEEAVRLMREHAIRRIPVVQSQRAVGIVSIGDLAKLKDPDSALADISAAAPNN